eukprot:scaffold1048_cov135-Skeletonema_marinoi.AAC.2
MKAMLNHQCSNKKMIIIFSRDPFSRPLRLPCWPTEEINAEARLRRALLIGNREPISLLSRKDRESLPAGTPRPPR